MDHSKIAFFTPSNIRHVADLGCGCCKLWTADISATQQGEALRTFKNISFIEADGAAFIAGIEEPDGVSERYSETNGPEQKAFIDYLRNATKEMCGMSQEGLYEGLEYYYEAVATSEYIRARGISAQAGIGYWHRGVFDRIAIDPLATVVNQPPEDESNAQWFATPLPTRH